MLLKNDVKIVNAIVSPKLVYRANELLSAASCQQSDPLGPDIFSLAIYHIIQNLYSNFNVWYLDNGTLGGFANIVRSDFKQIITVLTPLAPN